MREKLCWFCAHCYFSNGSPSYSEWTPGYDMSLGCNKNKWRVDNYETTVDEFRKMIHMAKNCEHYKEDKSLEP